MTAIGLAAVLIVAILVASLLLISIIVLFKTGGLRELTYVAEVVRAFRRRPRKKRRR